MLLILELGLFSQTIIHLSYLPVFKILGVNWLSTTSDMFYFLDEYRFTCLFSAAHCNLYWASQATTSEVVSGFSQTVENFLVLRMNDRLTLSVV